MAWVVVVSTLLFAVACHADVEQTRGLDCPKPPSIEEQGKLAGGVELGVGEFLGKIKAGSADIAGEWSSTVKSLSEKYPDVNETVRTLYAGYVCCQLINKDTKSPTAEAMSVLAICTHSIPAASRTHGTTIVNRGSGNTTVVGDNNTVIVSPELPLEMRALVDRLHREDIESRIATDYPLGYAIYYADGHRTVVDPHLPNLEFDSRDLAVAAVGVKAIQVQLPRQLLLGNINLGVVSPDSRPAVRITPGKIELCKEEGYRRLLAGPEGMAWIQDGTLDFTAWLEVVTVRGSDVSIAIGFRGITGIDAFAGSSRNNFCIPFS